MSELQPADSETWSAPGATNALARHRALDPERQRQWASLWAAALRRKNWSAERVARASIADLRRLAADESYSTDERLVFASTVVSCHFVRRVTGLQTPFLEKGRRAKLLALARVLGMDLAALNRCGGGL